MTEGPALQDLLEDLLETEKKIAALQSALKKMISAGGKGHELAALVEERKRNMQVLAKLEAVIEKELKNAEPAAKAQTEAVIHQVGVKLQKLAQGEQEILAAVEKQLKGGTAIRDTEQQGRPPGGKLDISQ